MRALTVVAPFLSVSVRAYGVEAAFIKELQRRSDRYTRASRTFYNLNRSVRP